jgi:drug/metabolite transporter (DMT)-like permease
MLGPILMLVAIGLFGVLDANSKLLSSDYAVWQVLLVRFATILACVFAIRAIVPGWGGGLGTRNPRQQALRALVMLGSASFFFQAFKRLPLAEGYLVFFTSPFIVLAFSVLLLGEKVSGRAWAWCAVGFGGVALGLAPSLLGGVGTAPLLGYAFALAGTLCYAMTFVLNRSLRNEAGLARVLVWPAVLGFVVVLPLGLMEWRTPTPLALAQMIGAGVVVAISTACTAEAFRHATASRLAPYGYSGMVWSVAFDLLFWGHAPTGLMLAGAVVVVLACLMSERAAKRSG